MQKQRGFTLIELLTVISIIALLLGIIVPTLSGVRRRAKAAVCLSNLRQWGMVYKMYTDEFDGKLPRDYDDSPWYYSISNYYSKERRILLCPAAKKPSSQSGTSKRSQYGSTFTAWDFFSPEPEEIAWNSIGSYGLNWWAYEPEREAPDVPENKEEQTTDEPAYNRHRFHWNIYRYDPIDTSGSSNEEQNELNDQSRYWEMAYEKKTSIIPLVFDSGWLYSYFSDNAAPPSKRDQATSTLRFSNTACIDRHDGGINMAFLDFSVRKVGLKELWTLKWHKQFNTAGKWTQAGGVLPEQWPKWMQKYKDY